MSCVRYTGARREQIRWGRWKALFHRIESGEKRVESIPGRGPACARPVTGRSLECLMSSEKASVTGRRQKDRQTNRWTEEGRERWGGDETR